MMFAKRLFAFFMAVFSILGFISCKKPDKTAKPLLHTDAPTAYATAFLPTVAPLPGDPALSSSPTAASSNEPSSSPLQTAKPLPTVAPSPVPAVSEEGTYDSKDDVALYIQLYGHLPSNYITKKQAQSLGWSGGSLEPYAPGKCIGGDTFGNYEGLLPKKKGRKYTECDIDTLGKSSRGAKRIVFSNDGLIFYTSDHYNTFKPIYGGSD